MLGARQSLFFLGSTDVHFGCRSGVTGYSHLRFYSVLPDVGNVLVIPCRQPVIQFISSVLTKK